LKFTDLLWNTLTYLGIQRVILNNKSKPIGIIHDFTGEYIYASRNGKDYLLSETYFY